MHEVETINCLLTSSHAGDIPSTEVGSEHRVVSDKSIGGSIAGPGSSITTASHTEESVSSMVAGTCAQHKQYCCLCPSVRGYMLAGGVMV